MASPAAHRAFTSLSNLYDALEATDAQDDLKSLGFPDTEIQAIQSKINGLMTDLESTLPSLDQTIRGGS